MGSPSNALNISQAGLVYFDGAYSFDGRVPISSTSTVGITITASTIDFVTLVNSINTITGNSGGPQSSSGGNFNLLGTGSITIVGTANTETVQLTGLTNHAVLIGAGTDTITKVGPVASTGAVLQSNGVGSDPGFSTATYPSVAGTTGKVLISDGTNIVSSTPTFPNASATSGKFIRSDGTNWIASTPTLPTTGGSTGTILRSDGTNFVNTTATYPTTTTVSQILYSSSANVIGGITTANNSILSTDASGVPSMGTSLSNSYTFTSSTAAVARTLTVSNTDNTSGSSEAILLASTGGTSSGDAYTRYVIGTARSYSIGIDNSDSQIFKLNTAASATTGPSSGTNILQITSGGNRTLPLNGCLLADLTTTVTDATGDGTTVSPVIFTNDSGNFFDQNGNYDTGTGLFTAAVSGKYLVSAVVTLGDLGVLHTSGIIKIFTSAVSSYGINVFNPGASKDGSNQYSAQITEIISASAGATIGIAVQVSGSTKTVDILGNNFGSYSRLSINLIS